MLYNLLGLSSSDVRECAVLKEALMQNQHAMYKLSSDEKETEGILSYRFLTSSLISI